MNMYDRFMRELIDYLKGTWLAKAHRPLEDKGSIRGHTYLEIEAAEQEIGKRLPASLKAWYRAAGAVPPYLYDYDADYSLDDLKRAQKAARELVSDESTKWEMTPHIIPFSQRIGEQFLFVDSAQGNSDDPPVFHFMEGHELPRQVDIAFSVCMREIWLGWLDWPFAGEDWRREHEKRLPQEAWLARKRRLDELSAAASQFRNELANRIYQEDLQRGALTGPRAFQERWRDEFAASEVWQTLKQEGLRFPYDWIDAPT